MVPSRPRRAVVRRALLSLLFVALGPGAALTMGTRWVAAADPTALPSSSPLPAPILASPTVSTIGQRPRQLSRPSAEIGLRLALDARLEALRVEYGLPGVSVAIVFPDGATWIGASGLADVGAAKPVAPDAVFALASLTKTFTSALVLLLAEEGRIGLDARIATYLPELALDPAITIRQLLDHTSGLGDYFFDAAIDELLLSKPDRTWTEADALALAGKPYFKPGAGWHYSNTNYLVLGMLAERVADAPLADQFRERFLTPLGLRSIYYQPTETALQPAAHGYRIETGAADAPVIDLTGTSPIVPFASVVTAARGAGGLASDSIDVARWARALYGGEVLTESSRTAQIDDAARIQHYRPTVPYGLGVQLIDIAGRPTMGHSGRLLGFRSAARFLPGTGLSIAVLTNQSRTDPGIIVEALLSIAARSTGDCACRSAR
ncbi:MAG: serine hydrolase domain-containing protein [Candidatus Limnocylindrales bacterium]